MNYQDNMLHTQCAIQNKSFGIILSNYKQDPVGNLHSRPARLLEKQIKKFESLPKLKASSMYYYTSYDYDTQALKKLAHIILFSCKYAVALHSCECKISFSEMILQDVLAPD